jgi:hypothetical protein
MLWHRNAVLGLRVVKLFKKVVRVVMVMEEEVVVYVSS